ncbi:rod-binding protein [Aureimonas sp. AU4]|uniref:rod-binding protein n=1 Tax=Aureimonas sp. AU4 TaxID=1638163 RepID=UPI00078326AA|nr:rod-binding protein [Aureimonas sp. AU4]
MTSVNSISAAQGATPASPVRAEASVASAGAANNGFAAAMTEAEAEAARHAPATSDPHFRHQTSKSGELKPEQAFESFVLRSFIEEMLPKENKAVFGSGTAGNIWRSMLAERIADEMAAGGGIGIAKAISRDAAPKAD